MDRPQLKPIQTVYNGYLFRSRLEARWAVFFDTYGLYFEYEDEGFDLGDGYYLPDFFVPAWETFLEIKPAKSDLAQGWGKCLRLQQQSGKRVVMLAGNPWPDAYIVKLYSQHELRTYRGRFAQCRKCDELWLASDDWATPLQKGGGCDTDIWPVPGSEKLERAYTAARQARFERRRRG